MQGGIEHHCSRKRLKGIGKNRVPIATAAFALTLAKNETTG
jgi:hypothetical protein